MEFQYVWQKQKEKKVVQMLLESNLFALFSLYSIAYSKWDVEPLLECDKYQISAW